MISPLYRSKFVVGKKIGKLIRIQFFLNGM